MKLMVIGFGKCGCKIADEFAWLNKRARTERHIEIVSGALAVDTDASDLAQLHNIRADYRQRILIGAETVRGHGVGNVIELGAELAKDGIDKVMDAIRLIKRFLEADAFLLIAAASGGTGSGAMPIMAQHLKARYMDRPIYSMIVLPFRDEGDIEERLLYNTATCLKSIHQVTDAVFLVDNQPYASKDSSLRGNMDKINQLIIEPFYDLLCVGEEKKAKRIGTRMLDAGDIMQTLSGWTAIGYGKSSLPPLKLPFEWTRHFTKENTKTHRGIKAMDEAIDTLSIRCKLTDSGGVLYLLTGPPREMNVELVKELGGYLRRMAPSATMREGDYPVGGRVISIVLVISQLSDVEKVREYYTKLTT
jgi:cell division GTPase FtsZ